MAEEQKELDEVGRKNHNQDVKNFPATHKVSACILHSVNQHSVCGMTPLWRERSREKKCVDIRGISFR